MSTPAPAPDAPFDPHAFPDDLVAAQRQVAELYEQLRAYQAKLPWSREPHPGWDEVNERGRQSRGRPASPGWTLEQAAEYDRLFEALRKAAEAVQAHGWWERCAKEGIKGGALVGTRMALKRAAEAASLRQEDVAVTA